VKDVLQHICIAHLVEVAIWNSLKDLICLRHTIKTIEKMTSFFHFKDLEMNLL